MFGWFTKRSRSGAATAGEASSTGLPEPVMREIPAGSPAASTGAGEGASATAPATPARPAVPPGSAPATHGVLVAQLRNADPEVRVAAARELGRRGDPAAVEALISALRDAQPAVRIAAAHALGKLRDERAVDALAAAMSSDADEKAQSAARGALQAIGTEPADAALVRDELAREQARREAHARAHPTLDRSRGIEGLIEAFCGDHAPLHTEAADALAEAGPAGVEPVAALLHHENVLTRQRAAELLGRIADARAAASLQAALQRISPEDRSLETYQCREALRRALLAVTPEPEPAPVPEPAPATSRRSDADGVTSTSRPEQAEAFSAPAPSDSALAELTEEQLGARLGEIARAAVGGGRPPLDSYDARREAARAIGAALHRRGGIDAMRRALDAHVGDLPGRHPIEQAWDGIGEWMG